MPGAEIQSRWHFIRRLLERGDGDTFAMTASAPLLFGLLAFGITVAALGFGRVGASAAAERGAYAAGTRVEGVAVGSAAAASFFAGWSGGPAANAGVSANGRTVRVTVGRRVAFGGAFLGAFTGSQTGAMEKRVERFYPGGGE